MPITQNPRGGVDARKYAAITAALGRARGALFAALAGDFEDAQQIMDATATARIAKVLGCEEADLAIDCDEFLTPDEIYRIGGYE